MLEATIIVVLGLAAVVGLVLARAARQPDMFEYARSTIIAARAEHIFPLIADPPTFNGWNPFNQDPSISGSYSGPARGPGARYAFTSKGAGSGYTEIVAERAPSHLQVRLVMTKPMACDNRVDFRLEPVGNGTRVTWAMSGPMSFAGKVMNQVINCERMCTGQFEKGLASLKLLAERQPETV